MVFTLGTVSFHKKIRIFAYSTIFAGLCFFSQYHTNRRSSGHLEKMQSKIFQFFSEQLDVWLSGVSISCRFFSSKCLANFFVHFSFCLYLSFFLSWIMKGLNRSLWRYNKISQWFHLMYNVSNQFDSNSFQKSNVLFNFELLLISCQLVTKPYLGKVPF